jgi:hypothetical protein
MTNNKQQMVVELIFQEMLEIQQSCKTLTFDENLDLLEKYKEMQKEQSQAYAEFCVKCDRNKLILLEFDSWVKLQPSRKEYYNTILRRRR